MPSSISRVDLLADRVQVIADARLLARLQQHARALRIDFGVLARRVLDEELAAVHRVLSSPSSVDRSTAYDSAWCTTLCDCCVAERVWIALM